MASTSQGHSLRQLSDEESGPRVRSTPRPTPSSSTEASRWHAERHHAILRNHPGVRRFFGIDRTTALYVVALVAAQMVLAVALRHASWGVLLVTAFVVGAPIAHALGVLIHECTHNLVFRSTASNKALAIFANLPLGAPAALEFRHQHLLHHRHLGDTREPDGSDTQAPIRREVRATGSSSWRKVLSFTFGRFVFAVRAANRPNVDRWLVANWVTSLGTSVGVFLLFGARPLVYFFAAALLAFGPHPLGARRLSEHLTLRRGQPTNSYYGVANRISFDVGYHVEHHDFPYVPWSRMRELRAQIPQYYDALAVIPSWTRLLLAHFFDRSRHVGQYVGLSDDYVESDQASTPLESSSERSP